MTSSTSPNRLCDICEEVADSVHFGALSCKACAAFFRRVVGGRQKIVKRCENNCLLKSRWRKICGSCRFEKCMQSGMRKELVESRASVKLPSNLLEKLQEAYDSLKKLRVMAFEKQASIWKYVEIQLSGSTYFQKEGVIKITNYKEMNEIILMDIKLINQSLIKFFETKTQLVDLHQRNLLAAHFVFPFLILHGSYKWNNENMFQLPNGDCIDMSCMDEYYVATEQSDEKAKQSQMILEPYWKLNKQVLQPHFSELKLDRAEFLLLSALIYWDSGLDEQTDECIEACQKMRFEVLTELTRYEKEKSNEEDHSLRVGQIMISLQTIQKSMTIVHEFKEVAKFFDLYGKDNPCFDIMKA